MNEKIIVDTDYLYALKINQRNDLEIEFRICSFSYCITDGTIEFNSCKTLNKRTTNFNEADPDIMGTISYEGTVRLYTEELYLCDISSLTPVINLIKEANNFAKEYFISKGYAFT